MAAPHSPPVGGRYRRRLRVQHASERAIYNAEALRIRTSDLRYAAPAIVRSNGENSKVAE